MMAYNFYWRDEIEIEHFPGIHPERRKSLERIKENSTPNSGMEYYRGNSDVNNIYYVHKRIN